MRVEYLGIPQGGNSLSHDIFSTLCHCRDGLPRPSTTTQRTYSMDPRKARSLYSSKDFPMRLMAVVLFVTKTVEVARPHSRGAPSTLPTATNAKRESNQPTNQPLSEVPSTAPFHDMCRIRLLSELAICRA